jgi:hypothetical protein
VTVFGPECVHLHLAIDGMRTEAKDAVKTFQRGDVVRLTVGPSPTLTFAREGSGLDVKNVVPGRGVRKIEKMGGK